MEDRIKTTVSLDFGTVQGNTWVERTAALPGLTVNSHVTVTPKYSVNFFYQGVCDANGILTIRVYNLSATAAALSHDFHVLVTN